MRMFEAVLLAREPRAKRRDALTIAPGTMHASTTLRSTRTIVRCITLFPLLLLAVAPLGAQRRPQRETAPAPAPTIISPWRVTGGIRVRAERWNWFDESAAGEYWFAGALARLGVERDGRPLGFRLELAAPVLLHLPDDAVRPAPAGPLGLGATYNAANFGDENAAQLFPKNAYVRWMRQWLRTTDAVRVG